MAGMLKLKDGSLHTVLTETDLFYLIGKYMGAEMETAVTDHFEEERTDREAYEEDIAELKSDHKKMVSELKTELGKLSNLVRREETVSREELDESVRKMTDITGREDYLWT